jgi:N-acyl homoserine lactone hydrolase
VIALKGRPRRLAILDYGLFRVHANGPRDRHLRLCRGDRRGRAGADRHRVSREVRRGCARATEEDALGAFGEVLRHGPGNLPAAQLALLGLAPADIDLQIVSHTHIDHIGGMGAFPAGADPDRRGRAALPRPLYWQGAQPMEWPEARIAASRAT